ncbi:PepSY-associated TM helix domain-containing protein [Halopseudomonas pachastrellae]|nr:PepSY-associated TM helix domain-containing protein [Halopseudomonas pachastrellae]
MWSKQAVVRRARRARRGAAGTDAAVGPLYRAGRSALRCGHAVVHFLSATLIVPTLRWKCPMLGSRIELTKGESMAFNAITGAALRVPEPSRATLLTQRVMAGLHFAQFGGYPMRWLYFSCGLISCAMIASGLVLYTVKRRRQAKVSANLAAPGRLAEYHGGGGPDGRLRSHVVGQSPAAG